MNRAVIRTIRVVLGAAACLATLTGCPMTEDRYGPIAEFSASPLIGDVPFKTTFEDHSIPGMNLWSGNEAVIYSWFWDFGDGGTSTAQNPTYIYRSKGLYTVSLTVRTAYGVNTITKEDYIEAGEPAVIKTTELQGVIEDDGRLDAVYNPYIVVGDVEIAEGAALLIGPGVELRFKGDYSITVRGTLDIQGEEGLGVLISTLGKAATKGAWGQIVYAPTAGGEVQWATIEGATTALHVVDSNIKVTSCTIRQCNTGVFIEKANAYGTLSGCALLENTQAVAISNAGWKSNISITDCRINDNDEGIGAEDVGGLIVADCYISQNADIALWANGSRSNSFTLTHNEVLRNGAGFDLDIPNTVVTYNRLEQNGVGIIYRSVPGTAQLNYNNLNANSTKALSYTGAGPDGEIDAKSNWWGSTDKTVIQTYIRNDGGTSIVFEPYLSKPASSVGVRD